MKHPMCKRFSPTVVIALTAVLATALASCAKKSDHASFASADEAVAALIEAGRKSDAQTQAVAGGKANIVDVVTAVSETEVAVEALVSVRDKMIQAYEEIMRMPI